MTQQELFDRCKKVWLRKYKELLEFKNRYGMNDEDTQAVFAELITTEDTISLITCGEVSYEQFEEWRWHVK